MTNQLDRGLGRIFIEDPRDIPYRIEATLMPPRPVRRTTKHWPLFRRPLDQGTEGTCVGHGWWHFLRTAPVIQTRQYPSAVEIYDECTQIDEWVQNDNFDRSFGTSVRSGGKVLKARGLIGSYHVTDSVHTMADWIGGRDENGKFIGGPLVWGSNWHEGMDFPDAEGYIKPTGSIRGGHCICWVGWNEKRGVFYGVNSWGVNYGLRGRFKMAAEDVDFLLRNGAEAWTAQEIRIAV